MPVITRTAALRSQLAEEAPSSAKSVAISKTARKCRPQSKQKQPKAQPPEISAESETCSTVSHKLSAPQVESGIEINNHRDHENKRLTKGNDISIESVSTDQELILSTPSDNKIVDQQANKKLASFHSGDHQSITLSASPPTSSITKSPMSTVEEVKNDYSL